MHFEFSKKDLHNREIFHDQAFSRMDTAPNPPQVQASIWSQTPLEVSIPI